MAPFSQEYDFGGHCLKLLEKQLRAIPCAVDTHTVVPAEVMYILLDSFLIWELVIDLQCDIRGFELPYLT